MEHLTGVLQDQLPRHVGSLYRLLDEEEDKQTAQRLRALSGTDEEAKALAPSEECANEDDVWPFNMASLENSWGRVEEEDWPLPLAKDDELLADLRAWVLEAMIGEPVVQTSLPGVPSWQQGTIGSDDEGPAENISPRQGMEDFAALSMTRTTSLTGGRRNQSLLEVLRPVVLADPVPEGDEIGAAPDDVSLTVADMVGSALGLSKGDLDSESKMLAGLRNLTDRGAGSSKALQSLQGARQVLASAVVWVADQASNSMAPDASRDTAGGDASATANGGSQCGATTSITVVLKRKSEEEKWGFIWLREGFKERGERVVESINEDLVAGAWNKQQEDSGHPERCILPLDRLVRANGKTTSEGIKKELVSKEVTLEFHRYSTRGIEADTSAVAEDSSRDAEKTGNDADKSGNGQKAFATAFSAYLQRQPVSVPSGAAVDSSAHEKVTEVEELSQSYEHGDQEATAEPARPALRDPPQLQMFRIASDPGDGTPMSASHTPKPRVASTLGSFLAQHSMPPSSFARPPLVKRAMTAPATESPTGAEVGEMERVSSIGEDPLQAAKPKMVPTRSMDPVGEKRDIGERLALRHRRTPSSSTYWQPPKESPTSSDRFSQEFEDDSLAKLSMALSNLERTARSAGKSGDQAPIDRNTSLSFDGAFEAFKDVKVPYRDAGKVTEKEAAQSSSSTAGQQQKPLIVPKASFADAFASRQRPISPLRSELVDEADVLVAEVMPHATPSRSAAEVKEAQSTPVAAAVLSKDVPRYRLLVQLADQPTPQTLEFLLDGDLPSEAASFVERYRLKELFKDALLGRMEEMVHSDRREDSVDIIDLI